jgi:hypothetical protein
MMRSNMGHGRQVLALSKGEEQYIVLYDEASRTDAFHALLRWALDPSLSFTWYDLTILAMRLSNTVHHGPLTLEDLGDG